MFLCLLFHLYSFCAVLICVVHNVLFIMTQHNSCAINFFWEVLFYEFEWCFPDSWKRAYCFCANRFQNYTASLYSCEQCVLVVHRERWCLDDQCPRLEKDLQNELMCAIFCITDATKCRYPRVFFNVLATAIEDVDVFQTLGCRYCQIFVWQDGVPLVRDQS